MASPVKKAAFLAAMKGIMGRRTAASKAMLASGAAVQPAKDQEKEAKK